MTISIRSPDDDEIDKRRLSGWRITPLVWVEVTSAEDTIEEFRCWLDECRISFWHSCRPYGANYHAGYYHADDAAKIEEWLKAHVEQHWTAEERRPAQ
jgi:hypothetical protein